MSDDSADELILKMKHLEAQAKTTREAEQLRGSADKLKSAAQKLAYASQREVTALEKAQEEAEKELDAIKVDGAPSAEAPQTDESVSVDRALPRRGRDAKSRGDEGRTCRHLVDLRGGGKRADSSEAPRADRDPEGIARRLKASRRHLLFETAPG